MNGIETVKAYNAEEEAKFKTEQKFISFLKTVFSHGMMNNFQSSLKHICNLSEESSFFGSGQMKC